MNYQDKRNSISFFLRFVLTLVLVLVLGVNSDKKLLAGPCVTNADCSGQWDGCLGSCTNNTDCPGSWLTCQGGFCMSNCGSYTCSPTFCPPPPACSDPLPTCTGVSANPVSITNLGSQNVVITATGVSNAQNWVRAFVWTHAGWQDDIAPYNMTNMGGGTYSVTVDMTAHPDIGTIYIHIYMDNCNAGEQFCGDPNITRINADIPSGYITATPNPAVFHFDNMSPTVNVTNTANDLGNNLTIINFPYRECTNAACDTGSWLPLTGVNPSYEFSPRRSNSITYPWRLTAPAPYVGRRYSLAINAHDSLDNRCSGNPLITTPMGVPWGSQPWYNCDDSPGDGTTDNVYLDVKAAPTGTIAASTLTVIPGNTVTFFPTAHDLDGNLTSIAVHKRKCLNATCTGGFVPYTNPVTGVTRADGWEVAMCSSSFAPAFSRALAGCTWTPGVSDIGTWEVGVNAFDSSSPILACSANYDNVYPRTSLPWGTWYNCGNRDLARVTVANAAAISGRVVDCGSATCDVAFLNNPTSPVLGFVTGANVVWETGGSPASYSSAIGAGSTYNISTGSIGPISLSTVGIDTSGVSRVDMVLEPVLAADSGGNQFNPSTGRFASPFPGYTVSGNMVINLGYAWNSLVDAGWVVSQDGDVYANAGVTGGIIQQTMPTSPTSFSGYLLEPLDSDYGLYVFSEDDINVKTAGVGGESRIVYTDEDADIYGGWTSNIPSSSYEIEGYDPYNTTNADSISLSSGVLPSADQGPIEVTVSEFNTWVANHSSYSVNGGGTAVMYVGGTGDIRFDSDLRSTGGRLLIITENLVIITGNVGVPASPSPAATVDPNIQAFILTSDNIRISDSPSGSEKVLFVEGSLVSTRGRINVLRNLGDLNVETPALVVRYDPAYLYTLIDQEQGSGSDTLYPGLMISNIQWKGDE